MPEISESIYFHEVGTERVVQPELLRAYNELLHRFTEAARDHVVGSKGYSLQGILEMLQAFADKNGRTREMKWAFEQAAKSPLTDG